MDSTSVNQIVVMLCQQQLHFNSANLFIAVVMFSHKDDIKDARLNMAALGNLTLNLCFFHFPFKVTLIIQIYLMTTTQGQSG